MTPQNNDLINLINVLAFLVGIENLNENRVQSAQNDVNAANDKQARFILREINQKFEEQNVILREILKIVKELKEVMYGSE